ncbi:MAG: DUF5671 domain-containing protein [bacterium]|nr:DUF5671 domain-containing protein [bacterium]
MQNNINAKYAFYYLLSLAALIFTAVSVQMIVFGIIDRTVTDAIAFNSYDSVDSQLRFAISALFIAAPIYYFLSRLIIKGLRKKELEMESPLRRWLTYLIILVAAVIILGVFVSVINNFLSGEMTSRFILKATSMLVMAAAVFSYYFYDMKRKTVDNKDKVITLFGWISAALVLAVFVSAWFFVESPATARAKRLDSILMNNIYQLENSVNTYYSQYGRLPVSLDEIKNSSDVYYDSRVETDPETGERIVYRLDGEDRFSFCATFRASSTSQGMERRPYGDNKDHDAGYDCVQGAFWGRDDIKGGAATKAMPTATIETVE